MKHHSSALLIFVWGETTSDWWIPLTKGPVMRQLTPWHYHEFWCTHCFHHCLSGCSGAVWHQPLNHYNISCDNTINSVALKLLNLNWQEGFKSSLMEVNINHNELILLYARLKNGTYYAVAMSVRLSVRPSVRPSVRVFRTFLQHALRYQFETWYIHSVGGTTCRVWVASQLGHFDLVYSQK